MLTVIIVGWNVRALLKACLASLEASPPSSGGMTVVVVDNASADGTCDMVAGEFPLVRLIRNSANRGFTGGNNDGLAAARAALPAGPLDGHFVLLLNPDTFVTPGALDALISCAEKTPGAGVIGPRLVYGNGEEQSSRRRFPTLATAVFESTWLQPIAPRNVLDAYFMRDMPNDRPCDADWVVGAAMLVRWTAIDQVGGMDETRFFMYSEETDWCRRMKAAGWRVIWFPGATITHLEARSSDQVTSQRMIRFNTSRARYFDKHHGPVAGGFVRAALLAGFWVQLLLESAKWLAGHKRALRAERIRAYAQAIKSGLA